MLRIIIMLPKGSLGDLRIGEAPKQKEFSKHVRGALKKNPPHFAMSAMKSYFTIRFCFRKTWSGFQSW